MSDEAPKPAPKGVSPVMKVTAPPEIPGSEDYPISFGRWAPSLIHTADEVWITYMKQKHGRENHKRVEWRALLDLCRKEPAH